MDRLDFIDARGHRMRLTLPSIRVVRTPVRSIDPNGGGIKYDATWGLEVVTEPDEEGNHCYEWVAGAEPDDFNA